MKSMSNHDRSQPPSPPAEKGKPKLIEKIDPLRKLCAVLFLSSLGCLTASANTAFTGMRNLTTLQITADMGAGWNVGNSMDAPCGETCWGNPTTTQAMITTVKQGGFKTMRLPVTWYNHIGGSPNYTIDPTWMSRVETIANYAFANDMYVIINTHHDSDWINPTYADEAVVKDKLVKIWTQIANKFRDYGDYLIFETFNEVRVHGSPYEWSGGNAEHRDVVNRYNLALVNAIRGTGGNNSTRHIMVPTCGHNGGSDTVNALVIPNNDSKCIVTVHNYSPFDFCLNENGTASWGTTAEKASLDAQFDILYNKFIANGRGVIIGEFGAIHKNNTSARATHHGFVATSLKARQIVPIVWDNGNNSTGALLNRSANTWAFPTIVDAITSPFNGGSGGTPPSAPMNLSASPTGKKKISLNWTQSTSPNVTQNKIYRSTTGSGGPYSLRTTISATTTFTDTGLTSGQQYFYAVTAVNSSGQESAYSNYAGATAR